MDRVKRFWNRYDVPSCNCPSLRYTHTHCLCEKCQGKAVSRATEYRHWTAVKRYLEFEVSASAPDTSSPTHSKPLAFEADEEVEPADESNTATVAEVDLELATAELTLEPTDDIAEQQQILGNACTSTNSASTSTSTCTSTCTSTTLTSLRSTARSDMVGSLIEVFHLADEMNASQQNVVELLKFARRTYTRGFQLCNDVTVTQESGLTSATSHEIEAIWPVTWPSAIKLLEEEGYEHPKRLSVCLNNCHFTNWDIMKEGERCRHCGETGDILFYYLTLSNKVCQMQDQYICALERQPCIINIRLSIKHAHTFALKKK